MSRTTAGLGIAMLPLYVARHVAGLEAVALAEPMPARELWMLAPPALAHIPRVRAVLDRVAKLFERNRHLL